MEFQWDSANEEHCQRHGVALADVERVIANGTISPDPLHSQNEARFHAFGEVSRGRWVVVFFTERGALVRPIGARFMHQKEVRKWQGK